jgi:hypothetical protein
MLQFNCLSSGARSGGLLTRGTSPSTVESNRRAQGRAQAASSGTTPAGRACARTRYARCPLNGDGQGQAGLSESLFLECFGMR